MDILTAVENFNTAIFKLENEQNYKTISIAISTSFNWFTCLIKTMLFLIIHI
jgi:hypothetical protein